MSEQVEKEYDLNGLAVCWPEVFEMLRCAEKATGQRVIPVSCDYDMAGAFHVAVKDIAIVTSDVAAIQYEFPAYRFVVRLHRHEPEEKRTMIFHGVAKLVNFTPRFESVVFQPISTDWKYVP